MNVQLTLVSGNEKVGPIPVSTTEKASCPRECPLLDKDCYARFGPIGIHWGKVSKGERGSNWGFFLRAVERFADGQLWRHNQAGDLPQNSKRKIHKVKLRQLSKASQHTKGWTYTHYDPTDEHNAEAIRETNDRGGLTVNLSADSASQADEYHSLGVGPVVCILPEDASNHGNKTPGGLPIVVCPAQTSEISCSDCKLCQVRDRKSIVGFKAHGTAKKRLSKRIQQ